MGNLAMCNCKKKEDAEELKIEKEDNINSKNRANNEILSNENGLSLRNESYNNINIDITPEESKRNFQKSLTKNNSHDLLVEINEDDKYMKYNLEF